MFVNLSIHYPKAQHRRDLIDSMHRFGAAAAGAPGLLRVAPLQGECGGPCGGCGGPCGDSVPCGAPCGEPCGVLCGEPCGPYGYGVPCGVLFGVQLPSLFRCDRLALLDMGGDRFAIGAEGRPRR